MNEFKEGTPTTIYQKVSMSLFDYWYHLNPVSDLKPEKPEHDILHKVIASIKLVEAVQGAAGFQT